MKDTKRACGVTVGTFDGVHLGHGLLLSTLAEACADRGLDPVVVTFDRHPLETICPDRAPGLLMEGCSRDALLRAAGCKVVVESFTAEYAGMTAAEWLERLHDAYGVALVVIGHDNKFGCDGRDMSVSDYVSLGRSLGVEVIVAPEREGVSSSVIRRLVTAGDVKAAERLLGRPFAICGKVVHGKALGRRIGFPTANVEPDYKALMPRRGVYYALADVGDGCIHRAVVNVGVRPSVDGEGSERLSVEAYLPGFSGDLYGRKIRLWFKRMLREEMTFHTLDDLRDAIARDVRDVLKEGKDMQGEQKRELESCSHATA